MNPVDVGAHTKEQSLFNIALLSTTAGTTNGTARDISGSNGRGLIIFACSALGAGNTSDCDIQEADDSSFTANVAVVNTYAVGGTTSTATVGVSAANTASYITRSIELAGRRQFLRARVITTGTTVTGQAHASIITGGHNALISGGPAF